MLRDRAAFGALEVRILAGFIVALSLLLAGGTYTYRTTVGAAAAAEWVEHTQEVRAALASLYGSLAGAEVALRDYVLTSESSHRNEYERSIQDIHLQLGNLRRLTADNTEQRQNVEALGALVAARLAAMTRALSAFADAGPAAAHAAMALERGARSTLEVRELTNRMIAIEERLLVARQTASTKVRQATLLSLLATLTVACGVFAALF